MNNNYTTERENELEKKLLDATAKYKLTLIGAIIIFVIICLVWLDRYRQFAQDGFFLSYNIIVYSALVLSAFWTSFFEKRVHDVLTGLMSDKACQNNAK